MTSASVRLAVASFLDGEEARALAVPPEVARRAATLVVESAFEHVGAAPRELDGDQVRALLLEVVPRRLGRRDPLVDAVPPVTRAFFEHLARTELVPHAFEIDLALADAAAGFAAAVAAVGDDERIAGATETIRNRAAPLGRNDPCPCGSGRKYKKCCGRA